MYSNSVGDGFVYKVL